MGVRKHPKARDRAPAVDIARLREVLGIGDEERDMSRAELRLVRKASGLSPGQFATLLRVGRRQYARYESGDSSIPPLVAREVRRIGRTVTVLRLEHSTTEEGENGSHQGEGSQG